MESIFDEIAKFKNSSASAKASLADELQKYGRYGDTMLAHISPEEAQLLKDNGGSGGTNPHTGLPEFFGFGKLFNPFAVAKASFNTVATPIKDAINIISNPLSKDSYQQLASDATKVDPGGLIPKNLENLGEKVAPAAISFIPGFGIPLAAAYTAANSYGKTGQLAPSLAKGAASYIGGNLGANYGANSSLLSGLGTVGSSVGTTAANMIPASIAGQSIGSAIGRYAGNSIGENLASSLVPFRQQATQQPGQNLTTVGGPTFTPGQVAQDNKLPSGTLQNGNLPNGATAPSIAGMSTLTPDQQRTSLATQGTYGGGLGPQEQQYFLNQENNKLVNQDHTTNQLSSLSPIENSYLAKLGLGGYGDTTSLLKAISQWNPQ